MFFIFMNISSKSYCIASIRAAVGQYQCQSVSRSSTQSELVIESQLSYILYFLYHTTFSHFSCGNMAVGKIGNFGKLWYNGGNWVIFIIMWFFFSGMINLKFNTKVIYI